MDTPKTLDRKSLKKAIAEGKTPQELQKVYGFSTVQKLYAAIRSLYEQAARAEKLIKELKANRKVAKKLNGEEPAKASATAAQVNAKQPVSTAPETDATNPTEASATAAQVNAKQPVSAALETDATNPTEASATAAQVNAKQPASTAPETDATNSAKASATAARVNAKQSTKTALKEVCKDLVAAKEHGCIVAVDYILNHGDNLKYIPKEKLVIPRQVLNILLSIANSKPIEEGRKIRSSVRWAENNATIIERLSDYRDGPLAQKAAKELAAIKKNNKLFCFAVLHARRMCGLPKAIPLTASREIRSVLSVWGM